MTEKSETQPPGMYCPGFQAAGVFAGIKKKAAGAAELKDLGLILADRPVQVAALFTRNQIQAAPVALSRQRVAAGTCRALIANSGNANCAIGPQGMRDALAMTRLAAEQLSVDPDGVLVASTGVIGQPLPMAVIQAALPELVRALQPDGFTAFARAIMTTDRVPKLALRTETMEGRPVHLLGMAKGAGMIQPDMATMLAFVCTDAAIASGQLKEMLTQAVNRTLNRITIDGDTSTNDSIFLMASGASGVEIQTPRQIAGFQDALDALLLDLARQLVKDGEGATKLVEIRVCGAPSDVAAHQVAATVANSPLVKTALFGEDANWGRVLAAAGRAGVAFDPEAVSIAFDERVIFQNGRWQGKELEARVTEVIRRPEFAITLDLHQGPGADTVYTCDLSVDYVRINADYRT